MKPLGIVRKVDELGRVVIPKEVRDAKGWEAGTPVEIFATDEGIFLREFGRKTEIDKLLDELDKANKLIANESVKSVILQAKEFISRG